MENKLFNNNFDEVDYGQERTKGSTITIEPAITARYEESITENIEDIYTHNKLMSRLSELYNESPYFQKYGIENKKIERADLEELYYYFKDVLLKENEYNLIQIFCAIVEFFNLNYKKMYNDIISLTDKAIILSQLTEQFGLQQRFSESKRLF